MRKIHRMINKIILEITLLVVMCIVSCVVFNTIKLENVEDDFVYTDINILSEKNYIGINDFPVDSQIKLSVSNLSNTSEKYNVLMTSQFNLSKYEDYLRVKIDDKSYLLKDLKVADNYFLIDKGNMKSNVKEIDLYFAVDEEYNNLLSAPLSFQFVNDINI